jgi:isoaspartyl peptidase/L-asparaginase-like protein (Ntn-hydrolase superfamily)
MEAATDFGWAHLTAGAGDPLAAVVAAVEFLENDGEFNAGRGSVPTTAGTVEMDAAVMDGNGWAGGVACISHHSPVRAAEAVLGLRGPVLIAGPSADTFATGAGVPRIAPLRAGSLDVADHAWPEEPAASDGTVGAVAVSGDGRFAAATSTGGRSGQIPGRVGDTPIPGAGLWASPGCAVSATGAGESFILAGFSRLVASRHFAGDPLAEALRAALDAVARYGGTGGGIALSGDHTWGAVFNTPAMARSMLHAGGRHTIVVD